MTTETYGDLHDYDTGDYIRPATAAERDASRRAAECDGGAGVIRVTTDGRILEQHQDARWEARRCYVEE